MITLFLSCLGVQAQSFQDTPFFTWRHEVCFLRIHVTVSCCCRFLLAFSGVVWTELRVYWHPKKHVMVLGTVDFSVTFWHLLGLYFHLGVGTQNVLSTSF